MITKLYLVLFWAKTLLRHLWLSVSSSIFYADVFKLYKGYGIKYLTNISFISSFIISVFLINESTRLSTDLMNFESSQVTSNIDHIINQFPDINYDGQAISVLESEPIIITNINNQNIIAIDSQSEISYSDRKKIPIVMHKDKIILTLFDTRGNPANVMSFKYNNIFSSNAKVINQEFIRVRLLEITKSAPTIITYFIFPVLALINLINALLSKSLMIVIIYFATYLLQIQTNMKSCVRVVLFSNGMLMLMQPLTLFASGLIATLLWILQIWTNILMIYGILRSTNKLRFNF